MSLNLAYQRLTERGLIVKTTPRLAEVGRLCSTEVAPSGLVELDFITSIEDASRKMVGVLHPWMEEFLQRESQRDGECAVNYFHVIPGC